MAQNDCLYSLLTGSNKARVEFDGSDILPANYVDRLAGEFTRIPDV